jgi:hypothetical protein
VPQVALQSFSAASVALIFFSDKIYKMKETIDMSSSISKFFDKYTPKTATRYLWLHINEFLPHLLVRRRAPRHRRHNTNPLFLLTAMFLFSKSLASLCTEFKKTRFFKLCFRSSFHQTDWCRRKSAETGEAARASPRVSPRQAAHPGGPSRGTWFGRCPSA